MKIRFASALLALALPVLAQDPIASDAEVMFYKAYYLEKGPKDHAAAMELYQKFLDKAPEHKLAAEAAKQQYRLLDQTGKSKERDAFKAKYEKLLGNIQPAPAGGDAARGGGARGEGGGRPDMQARIAELEKALEKAKADGNAEEVKRLEQQLERARQGGGRGGPGGAGGRGGVMRLLGSDKALKDMSAEELGQIKEGLAGASTMVDRIRDMGNEEMADKLEGGIAALQKALDGNDMEAAQKAVDELKKVMPQGGRGRGGQGGRPGEGGGQGGRPGQGGGPGGQAGGSGGER